MTQDVNKILIDFHACTDLCIGIFDHQDNHLYSYPEKKSLPFDSTNIQKAVLHTLSRLYAQKDTPYVTSSFTGGDINLKHVCFTACYVNPIYQDNGVFVFGPYAIIKDCEHGLPYVPQIATKHIVGLLHSITTEHLYGETTNPMSDNYHVNRIITYINFHYHENITLHGVANHFLLTKSYLCRLFKKETGQTFTSFLNSFRIEKSKQLMKAGNLSIMELSMAAGFNSQSYFCRQFKEIEGFTPKEYRHTLNRNRDLHR